MSRGASRAASIIAVVVLVIAVAAVLLYVTGQSRQAPATTPPSTSTAATSTATSAQDVALYAVAYKDITAGLLVTVLNYLILGKPLEGFNIGGLKG